MYQALLDDPKVGATDFAHLHVCVSGGAPLPAELKAKFEATAGARLVEGYGLSESSGVVSCNPYEGDGKSGTRSEEHTYELQSLMRISYAVFCLTKKKDLHKQMTNNKGRATQQLDNNRERHN